MENEIEEKEIECIIIDEREVNRVVKIEWKMSERLRSKEGIGIKSNEIFDVFRKEIIGGEEDSIMIEEKEKVKIMKIEEIEIKENKEEMILIEKEEEMKKEEERMVVESIVIIEIGDLIERILIDLNIRWKDLMDGIGKVNEERKIDLEERIGKIVKLKIEDMIVDGIERGDKSRKRKKSERLRWKEIFILKEDKESWMKEKGKKKIEKWIGWINRREDGKKSEKSEKIGRKKGKNNEVIEKKKSKEGEDRSR